MAITLVPGGALSGAANSPTNVTITLPTLQAGDVVVVCGGHGHLGGDTAAAPVTTGYTQLALNDGTSPDVGVWWKRMGASPDTTFVGLASNTSNTISAYSLLCLRGVVASGSIEDATATTAGPTTSTNPDCPSITTATPGAWVIACAGSDNNDASITAPSGYSNLTTGTGASDRSMTSAMSAKEVASPGAENPASYTTWLSGAWFAVTVAVKPLSVVTAAETLALADALAMKMGKVLTDSATLAEALALKTGKVVTDAMSLADAVSTVLIRTVSPTDALSILDALSLKTGKALTEILTLTDGVSMVLTSLWGVVTPAVGSWSVVTPPSGETVSPLRRSLLGLLGGMIPPTPDGTISTDDRRHLSGYPLRTTTPWGWAAVTPSATTWS